MSVALNIKNTRVFANTAARVSAVPAFIGQIGVQLDNAGIYRATATTVGAWSDDWRVGQIYVNEFVELPNQGADPSAPINGLKIYAVGGTQFAIRNTSGFSADFETGLLTDTREFILPDTSGTLLVEADLSFLNGDHGNITVSGAGATAGTWTINNGVVTNAKLVTGLVAPRIAATWADVYATAADRDGQIGVSNDGSVGVFRDGVGGTNQQKWESDVVWKPGINYFRNVNIQTGLIQSGGSALLRDLDIASGFDIEIVNGSLFATNTGDGPAAQFVSNDSTSISPWTFQNTNAVGLANSDWIQSDGIGGITIGTGNASVGAVYARRGVIETFFGLAGGTSGKAMPLDFRQFGLYSGATEGHVMLTLDSDAGVTIYGYTAATERASQKVVISAEAHVTIGGGATASELRLLEPSGSGTNYTALKAQAQAGNVTYTLPNADGTSGYALTTNGSGTLAWAAMATGSGTKTKAVFTPLDNQPPAANFATIDTRNSIALLAFDETTEESAIFVGVMPEGASLGSGLTVTVKSVAVATTGDFRLGAAWMRCNTDIDSDSFDTAVEATTTISGTSGIPVSTDLTTTNIDGITAGDMFRLKIYRDTSDGGDTMSGDLQCLTFEVKTVA